MMEPYAWAIVCDEVRLEANGKPFIIGMYPHDMIFSKLPASLAQLNIMISLCSDIKAPIKTFTVDVDWPGGKFSHKVEVEEIPEPRLPDVKRFEASSFVTIGPMQINGPGILTIMINYEKGQFRARRVRLIVAPPVAAAGAPSPTA